MLELKEKFKQALGNGVRTSLYPLIKIYRDVSIENPGSWVDAEQINLSTKEVTISGEAFSPLLLTSPKISSKADIVNNKFTISNVSLSISDALYNGKIFSDNIQNLLNAVVQVYYCSNGIDSIDDCLLVYTGTIRRYKQTATTLTLILEDITQQKLQTKIPSTLIPEEGYREEDVGKPYPMVFGNVNQSPLIVKSVGVNESEGLEDALASLEIDKPGQNIFGAFYNHNLSDYGHTYLTEDHPLIANGWYDPTSSFLTSHSDDNGSIPMMYKQPKNWSGDFDIGDEDVTVYEFQQSSANTSACIAINPDANFELEGDEEDFLGIPTRIYRPIERVECQVKNGDVMNVPFYSSRNQIWGFSNYFAGGGDGWKPWWKSHTIEGNPIYDSNPLQWWQPTKCNEETWGTEYTSVDENWKDNNQNEGLFPVLRLQNGNTWEGMCVAGRNSDNADLKGYGYIRMIFEHFESSAPCSTRYVYDGEYHSFSSMVNDVVSQGNFYGYRSPYPCRFWKGGVPSFDMDKYAHTGDAPLNAYELYIGDTDSSVQTGMDDHIDWPYFPNQDDVPWNSYDGWISTYNDLHDAGADDGETQGSMKAYHQHQESGDWDYVSAFDSVCFGIPKYADYGNDGFYDVGYACGVLYNFYLLHDTIITEPLNKDYFGAVKGRTSVGSASIPGFDDLTMYNNGSSGQKLINIQVGVEVDEELYPLIVDAFADGENRLTLIGGTLRLYVLNQSATDFEWIDYPLDGDYTINRLWLPNEEGNPWNSGFGIQLDADHLPYSHHESGGSEGATLWDQCDWVYYYEGQHKVDKCDYIVKNILEKELGYEGNFTTSTYGNNWKNAFTITKQVEAKKLIEELVKSSVNIIAYDSEGQFKTLDIKQLIDENTDLIEIKSRDLLGYSFSLSKIEDVKNQVNVKYKKNYITGELDKETGFSLVDADNQLYDTYDAVTEAIYPDEPSKHYSIDYYGVKSEDSKLEVASEYIRDEYTARLLQKRLVSWHCNQHLIIKVDLPIHYINLEVGDYIQFDELVGGKLAFGYNYTQLTVKNGQAIYPVFFISKINKTTNKISIEAIQMHRGEYGITWEFDEIDDDGDIIIDEEIGVDGGGNNGMGNWDLTDPFDFGGGTTGNQDEEYLLASWYNNHSNLNNPPINAIINTNTTSEWEYSVWVTSVNETFQLPSEGMTSQSLLAGTYTVGQESAENYLIVNATTVEGGYSGGLEIMPLLDLPNGIEIEYTLSVGNDVGTHQLTFTQSGFPLGDVTGDYVVNILDVVRTVNLIIHYYNYTEYEIEQGDVNDDNVTNILDVVALVNMILSGV